MEKALKLKTYRMKNVIEAAQIVSVMHNSSKVATLYFDRDDVRNKVVVPADLEPKPGSYYMIRTDGDHQIMSEDRFNRLFEPVESGVDDEHRRQEQAEEGHAGDLECDDPQGS